GPRRSPPRSGRSELPDPPPEAGALISSAIILLRIQTCKWSDGPIRRPCLNLCRNRRRFRAGFSRGWRRSSRRRVSRCLAARVTKLLDLFQTLLFLVNAHGEKFDHRFTDAQAAF